MLGLDVTVVVEQRHDPISLRSLVEHPFHITVNLDRHQAVYNFLQDQAQHSHGPIIQPEAQWHVEENELALTKPTRCCQWLASGSRKNPVIPGLDRTEAKELRCN